MVVPASGSTVPTDEEILKLAAEIAPDAEAVRLGGWISVNFRLKRSARNEGERAESATDGDLVLHVHPRYLSRRRIRAVQRLRQAAAASGLIVPLALPHRGATVIRCGTSLAEIEHFLPNEQLPPSWPAYRWLYRAMGTIHRVLATTDVELPRPLHTHYAAAGTLRSWIPPTNAAARDHPEATAAAEGLDVVTRRIRNRWVPPSQLPTQLVHGDLKLENVLRAPTGRTIYLDFGHSARRPRIHDLAFALTHTVLTVDGDVPTDPAAFPWEQVPPLIEEYQAAAGWTLTPVERRALAPYTAAVRLYFGCAAWHAASDPIDWLCGQRPSLDLSQWLLDHPDAILPT
ncbi:phosphotransferase enzyme family protein [Flindersiella endophytica]